MMKKEQRNRLFIPFVVALIVGCLSFVAVLLDGTIIYLLVHFGVLEGMTQETVSPTSVLFITFIINYIVALIMVLLLSKISLKPVNLLIEKMNQLISGDYSARIKPSKMLKRYSSIVELSESFNKLAEELGNTEMLRGDFVNNFSHEFKTPIASIAGFAKLLKKGNLTEERKLEYLDIIEEESHRLSVMATNVLNLTKIENQTILTDVTSFNLSEQLRKCVLLSEAKWSKKKITFELELKETQVDANEELLKQVWINLFDNAIKFSPEGGTVSVYIERGEINTVVFVCNEGEIIPEEKRKKIFNKFYQADESHSSEGNGIGLAIVKRVVELHKGAVEVESREGMTKFMIILSNNEKSFVSV